jgi:alpha-galactosidase/6-phospho-beta-glucosidase family protein
MSGGTSIDDLMKNVNEGGNFSDNENSMVDSIINELNGGPSNSQHNKPQINNEERELLMKQQKQQQQEKMQHQRMMQKQMMKQQQMKQQMQHQQMMQQQMMQQQQMIDNMKKKEEEEKQEEEKQEEEKSTLDKVLAFLYSSKEYIIFFVLTLLFSFSEVNSLITIKGNSLFYDITTNQPTFIMLFLRATLISSLFLGVKLMLDK